MRVNKSIAIVGTVGVPANYGGFETLVENLVRYNERVSGKYDLTVYCSSVVHHKRQPLYKSANLRYLPFRANGVESILYDAISLFSAAWNRNDVILVLGVSGAIVIPVIRLIFSGRIITNVDGIESRRGKWGWLARRFLSVSERIAIRFSHELISDNDAIAQYLKSQYGASSRTIAYGGDHAVTVDTKPLNLSLPVHYAVAVCRIEPENNIRVILEAFSKEENLKLVIVGNWDNSPFGRALRRKYGQMNNIFLLDPIYDLGKLKTLRSGAFAYIHGHSAGGTNPSLVEAMHFGVAAIAFDCDFNRNTTEQKALYFTDADSLQGCLGGLTVKHRDEVGRAMFEVAQRRYTWDTVASEYYDLM